ncbi:MAG: twin-arginine translocase subunit TatC [bacterium]|nr:twin-arginine translocase subunit TatC [bacterium]
MPFFGGDSFAVQFFKILQHDFMPPGVALIVTNPMSGFIVQVEIAMTLAFILCFPFFLYKVMTYLSPALFEHEKKALFKSLLLSSALFILGCLFAYYYMIPLTFKFMYPFTIALEVIPFFTLDAFMSWIIGILFATGLTFLLPVFMVILSFVGVVSPDYWRSKWHYAFVFLLIFSAVITPDQTGVTMLLLFIPLVALYIFGALLANRAVR